MFLQRNFSLKTGILVTVLSVTCADAAAPFSQYGMIQNVQNYSGNPFYNASTGTVTTPRMVYASGPGLKPDECQNVTLALIKNICNAQNNCKNATLADIRPTLMVQLSLLPGGSYATSCAGYIDAAYQEYLKQKKTTNSVNVFTSSTTKSNTPQWKTEYDERAAELKALQAQTKTTTDTVTKTDFPTIFEDLSFEQKNNIKRQGYEPYKNAKVYVPLNIVPETPDYSGECMAIHRCISNYNLQEQTAEDKFYYASEQFKNNVTGAGNQENYIAATEGLATATVQACMSPCLCTTDIKNPQQYLDKMGVQCNNTFLEYCKEKAKQYGHEMIDKANK